MPITDATERYLTDINACPVPAPELQLQWAVGIDQAQQRLNLAVASSPVAGRCLLTLYRSLPHGDGAAHVLARWVACERLDGLSAEATNTVLEVCLDGLADAIESDPRRSPDGMLAWLRPLRLRTEFMAELIAALHAADVEAEALDVAIESVARIRAGTDQLVQANQRLVATLARQYRNGPLAFMDLVQEGNLGLLRAIERFDPDHGTRVSTYAMWWVRRAMVYAIARQGRDVRPSVAQYWGARGVMRAMDRLEREQGRRATYRETAGQLGTTVAEVQRHLGTLAPPLALDAPIDATAGIARIERLECLPEYGPEQAALAGDLHRAVGELLAQLSERHAKILRMRFGIGVHEDCTLEQIAQQQGVTRERIRQLEAQALNALRRLDSAWALRGCLG